MEDGFSALVFVLFELLWVFIPISLLKKLCIFLILKNKSVHEAANICQSVHLPLVSLFHFPSASSQFLQYHLARLQIPHSEIDNS